MTDYEEATRRTQEPTSYESEGEPVYGTANEGKIGLTGLDEDDPIEGMVNKLEEIKETQV